MPFPDDLSVDKLSPDDLPLDNISLDEQPKTDRLPRFLLRQLVATPSALSTLVGHRVSPWALLNRHVQGDWGDLDKHDRRENERALIEGTRLLSAYSLASGVRIWIITEADRSATTLLLPEEY